VTDSVLRRALVLVAAAGIVLSAYLTWAHYEPSALVCTGNGGCEKVQQSGYATLVGLSVAFLGLVAWIATLGLTLWSDPLARTLTAALALGAALFAGYLIILQLFVIDALCIWCTINDVVLVPLLCLLALLRLRDTAEDATNPNSAALT
jgi:uncharacterized membrane protein